MNEEEKELISQILVSEEKQIEADIIRIMQERNIKDKQKAYEIIKKHLEKERKRSISYR